MKALKIETVFIPKEIKKDSTSVCVVVDAIRASCTIVSFLEKGYKNILLTANERRSMEINPDIKGDKYYICAEAVEGTKAPLAHFSPSLTEINNLSCDNNRNILFRTTNGTVCVHTLIDIGIDEIFIGSMLNLDAVAKAALDRAVEKETGVCVVCAGRENGGIYCIDDTYCSAKILEKVIQFANEKNIPVDVQDSTKIAISMANSYKDAYDAFSKSATGQIMRNANTEEDIKLCSLDNISNIVPKVTGIDRYDHIIINKY